MENLTKHDEFVQGLLALAYFYQSHPNCPLPDFFTDFTIYEGDKEALSAIARELGTCDKVFNETTFKLVKTFSPSIRLQTFSSREKVCEQVKVGEKTVDIMEWRCGSILAGEVTK
jgi:hypothetical protein